MKQSQFDPGSGPAKRQRKELTQEQKKLKGTATEHGRKHQPASDAHSTDGENCGI